MRWPWRKQQQKSNEPTGSFKNVPVLDEVPLPFRPTDDSKKIVEVALAAAVPLDPTKKYLIVFDSAAISKQSVAGVVHELNEMGIQASLGIVTDGDPWTSVQVIEVGH